MWTSGGPRGTLPGISRTLREIFASWRAGRADVEEILPQYRVTIPLPDLVTFPWVQQGTTASIGAGGVATLYTCPADEQAWFHGLFFIRATGAGDINSLEVVYPSAYRAGTPGTGYPAGAVMFVRGLSATAGLFPAIARDNHMSPLYPGIPLPPGGSVTLTAGGGTASTYDFNMLLTRTKVFRARGPA